MYIESETETKDELNVSTKEAAIAYYTERHNISFRSNDCTSKLIRVTNKRSYCCDT